MELKVNGEVMSVAERCKVRDLLDQLGIDKGPVAVERNGEVIPRATHQEVELAEGDVIEIVHFVGGG